MDIRLLEKNDIDEAKALWKEAFGDSDRFIEWYFANKVLPGNSLGMFDGRLVSALHMIPFEIRVQGRSFQSAFIAGAATAKSRRGQGLMRTLLLEALLLLRSRNILMTHLYPFKHIFYEKFGWATYSYVYNKTLDIQDGFPAGEVIETVDWRLLAPAYSGMMSRFDGYIIRGGREWEWRMGELMADGGKAALLIKNGAPVAYMLYYDNEGKAEAIETVYDKEEDLYPLLKAVLKNNTSAIYSIPAAGPNGAAPYGPEPMVPYCMARVVDARALLGFFRAEGILEHIRISDGFAGWNNVGEGIEIDVNTLAKIVHRGVKNTSGKDERFYNSLFKDVFSPRATCIFEQY